MHLSQNNIIVSLDNDTQWKHVLVNPLSGHVNLLDDEYHHYISSLDNSSDRCIDLEKEERLLNRGYMYQNETDEAEKSNAMLAELLKTDMENKFNNYSVIPNNSCTQACPDCRHRDRLDGRQLSLDDVDRIVAFIKKNEREDGLKQNPLLCLFGGDTMPDSEQGFAVFKRFINHLDSFGHLRIFSFGFNLDRYKPLLSQLDPKKTTFSFRLLENSLNQDTGNLLSESVEASIDWLRVHGFRISLTVKLTEENISLMPDYVNVFIEKGYVYSNNCSMYIKPTQKGNCSLFRPCTADYDLFRDVFRLCAQYPQLEALTFSCHGFVMTLQNLIKSRDRFDPRTLFCAANWNLHIIEPDGTISPCYHALGDGSLAVGNALYGESGLLERDKLNPWREREVDTIPSCRSCSGKYFCSGGCTYNALEEKGLLSESSCTPYRTIIKWAFEILHDDFMESVKYNKIIQESRQDACAIPAQAG